MWPLFREFRQTGQLASAYKNIFGYDFTDKLRSKAADAEKEAQKEAKKEVTETAARERTGSCKLGWRRVDRDMA